MGKGGTTRKIISVKSRKIPPLPPTLVFRTKQLRKQVIALKVAPRMLNPSGKRRHLLETGTISMILQRAERFLQR